MVELAAAARFERIDVGDQRGRTLGVGADGGLAAGARQRQRQFRVNTVLPARLAVQVARAFWRDRDLENRSLNRNVVNVSSSAGVAIHPGQGQGVLPARQKVALNFLTRHLVSEFSRFGVRVNALAPDRFPRPGADPCGGSGAQPARHRARRRAGCL